MPAESNSKSRARGHGSSGSCLELREQPPAAARIHSLEAGWLPAAGYSSFEIRPSDGAGERAAVLLPELATCEACMAEVLDPGDRRHAYAFANCTHCGPRFTIIRALPYDRPNTSMAGFPLCDACRAEYEDPRDRRFHAQPVACPACGPHLEFVEHGGAVLATGGAALDRASACVLDGGVVAVKGLGGFHLVCDAASEPAVARLRVGKRRLEKPFALMVRDLEQARTLCDVSAPAERVLASPEAPIVLLPRRADAPVAAGVAPGMPMLGVMLPSTPLHHLLMRAVGRPVVATSGNRSDEPIAIDGDEARARLGDVAGHFLTHDRPIERHVDDSVGTFMDGAFVLMRRARGYAPLPVMLARAAPTLLAVGAHLKSAVALSVGRQVFVSQHLGDLETPGAVQAFERVIADFVRLYDARPVAIAHDMHPDYTSTQWARAAAWPTSVPPPALIAVQHHHAHLAACLAEHGDPGKALGVIWDGAGLGADGTIWGGEFLLGDSADCVRVASLRPFRLPGGDAAAREPRRMALALLHGLLGRDAFAREDLPAIGTFSRVEREVFARMLETGTRAPWTTSAGRLFDGLAALVGLHAVTSYEGQAAIAFEAIATGRTVAPYPLPLTAPAQGARRSNSTGARWSLAVLEDLSRGRDRATSRPHRTPRSWRERRPWRSGGAGARRVERRLHAEPPARRGSARDPAPPGARRAHASPGAAQ